MSLKLKALVRRGFRVLVGSEYIGASDMTEMDAWGLFLDRAKTASRVELLRDGRSVARVWNPIKEVN